MRVADKTPEAAAIQTATHRRVGRAGRFRLEDAPGIIRLQAGQLDITYVEQWAPTLGLDKQWQAARAEAT